MVALGLLAGLIYGWIISPVKYVNTTPDTLRADYRTDYVLMVAEIYHTDSNLEQAAQRLAFLGSQPPARLVADGIINARALGYSSNDLDLLNQLSQALQEPTAMPTKGSQP